MQIQVPIVIERVRNDAFVMAFDAMPAAQEHFRKVAKAQNGYFSKDEIDNALKTYGYLENEEGTWSLTVCYSEE